MTGSRPPLILASQSPARKRLLRRLGYRFSVLPSWIDEEAISRKIREPRALVRQLAHAKARHVAAMRPRAVVIGSDQILVFQGKIFGKPLTAHRARQQLQTFSGHEVLLLTAVTVCRPGGGERSFVDCVRMQFRKLTGAEIDASLKLDQPLECAGSFKFEQHGIALFVSVRTSDPSSIEGLPLLKLHGVLHDIYHAYSV